MTDDKVLNVQRGKRFLAESMKFLDCYIYYDGPRFYLLADIDDSIFFAIWIEEEDEYDVWLLVLVQEIDLLRAITKKINFSDVMHRSHCCISVCQFYDGREPIFSDATDNAINSCLSMDLGPIDDWRSSGAGKFLDRDIVDEPVKLFGGRLDSEGVNGSFAAGFFQSSSKCIAALGSEFEIGDAVRFDNISSGSLLFNMKIHENVLEGKVALRLFISALKGGYIFDDNDLACVHFTKLFGTMSDYGVGFKCSDVLVSPAEVKLIADNLTKSRHEKSQGHIEFIGKLVTGSLYRGMLDVEVISIIDDSGDVLKVRSNLKVKVPKSKRYFVRGRVLGGIYRVECRFSCVNNIYSYELLVIESIYSDNYNGIEFDKALYPFVKKDWFFYWSKKMSKTDAQQQTQGSPVPYLRLSSGVFSSDNYMDFQTWFRYHFFVEPWSIVEGSPSEEEVFVPFKIFCEDVFKFEVILRVSHNEGRSKYKKSDGLTDLKDSHNNPTTWIHFDGIMRDFLKTNDMSSKLVCVVRDVVGNYSIRFYEFSDGSNV